MKYIIINPERTTPEKAVFWKQDEGGYTSIPWNAGLFTEEQVKGRWARYNNGFTSVAIPMTIDALDRLGFSCSIDVASLKVFLHRSTGEEAVAS